jgi:protein-S-isoprenylcysteine O-methyltransferase Ste14
MPPSHSVLARAPVTSGALEAAAADGDRRRLRADWLPKQAQRRLGDLLLAWLWLLFAASNVAVWHRDRRPIGAPFAAVELVAAVLFVVRRPSRKLDQLPLPAWFAGISGTALPLLLRPESRGGGSIDDVLLAIQFAGALLAIASLLMLGRSFGIVADNRGLRTAGLYTVVRHPLYASYLCIIASYAAANPTHWNLGVTGAIVCTVVWRIRWEEHCLLRDPAYRQYALSVPWRLVPLVY